MIGTWWVEVDRERWPSRLMFSAVLHGHLGPVTGCAALMKVQCTISQPRSPV
jgi:hypothetical protein